MDEIWEVERALWMGGADIYERHLGPETLMVFADPVGVLERGATLDTVRREPRWVHATFSRQRCIVPSADVVILAYAVDADRGSSNSRYDALCTSTYVRMRNAWKLVCHQQCPSSVQRTVAMPGLWMSSYGLART